MREFFAFLKRWGPLLGPVTTIFIFLVSITNRLSKLEGTMEALLTFNPNLKKAEELAKKLNAFKHPEDIRKVVSEVLKSTEITQEVISDVIKEEVDKRFSEIDKGIAALVAQKVKEAHKQFKKPVANVSDYIKLGDVQYDEKNYEEAIWYYNKAIEQDPDNAVVWNNKGIALIRLNRYDEALKAYDKAIKLDPDDAVVWNNKGGALRRLNRYDEALKAYDKAIKLDPDDALPWYNKGTLFIELNMYDEALKAFEKAIELASDFAEAWYNRASIYSLKRNKRATLKNLSKSIQLDVKYKERAKEDGYFKNFWDDEDFKRITKE